MNDLERLAQNKSFVPGTRLQFVWDSVSLGLFKECPWKYYLTLIQGWEKKRTPPPLSFGILFHSAMEHWHKLLAEGTPPAEALELVVHCAAIRGSYLIEEGDPTRNWQSLVRAIIWYVDQFKNDNAQTILLANGKPAVELSFVFEFIEIDGVKFYLAGHMDRLVKIGTEFRFADYKTTKSALDERFFSGFSPDNQINLYTLASRIVFETEAVGGIIDGVQLGVNFNRFKRGFVDRSPSQIEEWVEDTTFWLHLAKRCADTQQWPMNDKSCSNYGGCAFRRVCSKIPDIRENFLMVNFKRRIWDPLQPR